jgi:uncharacterized membrane protein (DUF373 family)
VATRQYSTTTEPRKWVSRLFTLVEDIVYMGLGLLLSASAIALLVRTVVRFSGALLGGTSDTLAIELIESVLLVLLLVELLYTVQVSFREHVITAEPFLLVGFIATIRRILVLTAEFPQLAERGETFVRHGMIELGLLSVLVLILVLALVLLRRRPEPPAVSRV